MRNSWESTEGFAQALAIFRTMAEPSSMALARTKVLDLLEIVIMKKYPPSQYAEAIALCHHPAVVDHSMEFHCSPSDRPKSSVNYWRFPVFSSEVSSALVSNLRGQSFLSIVFLGAPPCPSHVPFYVGLQSSGTAAGIGIIFLVGVAISQSLLTFANIQPRQYSCFAESLNTVSHLSFKAWDFVPSAHVNQHSTAFEKRNWGS